MNKCYIYYEGDPEVSAVLQFMDIVRYSLVPYEGRVLINDGKPKAMHGTISHWPHKLLVEFPDRSAAEQWYYSALFGMILEKARVWPDGNLLMLEGEAA